MSNKELSKYEELRKVHEKRQTMAQAAENLNMSLRQAKRLSKSLRTFGARGLLSKKVGKASNRQVPIGSREIALSLIQEHYADFGPTLAHEYLKERHGVRLAISTIRNIMIKNEIWISKTHRRKRIFQLRPRRHREGELIQLDGSEHEWFEGRGPYCTLISFIDDATSKIMFLKFVKSENVVDYFSAMEGYIEKHGRPVTLYPDKHGVFRVNREGALSGTGMTQFGRAMKELDIQLICANTPQAKGRVERGHQTYKIDWLKQCAFRRLSHSKTRMRFCPLS